MEENSLVYNILLIVQIMVSISMGVLILLQQGKGADAGAAFGSGASGTVFGAGGAGNFMTRTTAILATVFFVNCLALAWFVSQKTVTSSVVESVMPSTTPKAPVIDTDVPAQSGQPKASVSTPQAEDVPVQTEQSNTPVSSTQTKDVPVQIGTSTETQEYTPVQDNTEPNLNGAKTE